MNTRTTTSAYRPSYTPAEEDYLRANYATATPAEIMAAVPGRKWNIIRCKASKMGVSGRPAGSAGSATTPWTPANRAVLHQLYPLPDGVNLVMAATGLRRCAVQGCAARLGLKCGPRVRHPRPTVPKTPRVAAVKCAVAKVAAPKQAVVKVARVTPVKATPPPRCLTPVANASKLKRQRSTPVVAIKAEQIRKMPYADPQRVAYTNGGQAGWALYMKTQA